MLLCWSVLPVQGAQVRSLVRELDPMCHNQDRVHPPKLVLRNESTILFKYFVLRDINKNNKVYTNFITPLEYSILFNFYD